LHYINNKQVIIEMKRLYFLLPFAAILAMVFISSCGSNDNETIAMDSITVDRAVSISNEVNAPSCKVHISLLFAHENNGSKAKFVNKAIIAKIFGFEKLEVKQAVDSFTNNYLSNYKKNLTKLYNADRKDKNSKSLGWYDYHYILKGSSMKGRKGIMIYNLELDSYEGGVHGISEQQNLNFSTRSGKRLTLNDIFVPGYKEELNSLLLKALEDKTGSKDINELHRRSYLLSNDMYATENFMLNDGTITFVYNPYEIAPFAVGSTELTLSDSDLSNILKK
jgi:hypothetical protein